MSQDETQSTAPDRDEDVTAEREQEPDVAAAEESESTVGMGTSLALGCIAGTILLVVIGLIYVGLTALF